MIKWKEIYDSASYAFIIRLKEMDEEDAQRRDREEAYNNLEAFVYMTREKLDTPAFKDASTSSDRVAISGQLDKVAEWLYGDGELPETTIKQFQEKLGGLRKLTDPIFHRQLENERRPVAIKDLKTVLKKTLGLVEKAQKLAEASSATTTELDPLLELQANISQWLSDKEEAQSKVAPHQDPVLFVKDIQVRIKEFEATSKRILAKKRPIPVKPKVNETKAETAEDKEKAGTPGSTSDSNNAENVTKEDEPVEESAGDEPTREDHHEKDEL
jgi:hypoxia up-regulated 1